MATCSHDNKVRLFDMAILNEDEEDDGKREHESESSEEEKKGEKAKNLKRRKVVPTSKSSGFYDDLFHVCLLDFDGYLLSFDCILQ